MKQQTPVVPVEKTEKSSPAVAVSIVAAIIAIAAWGYGFSGGFSGKTDMEELQDTVSTQEETIKDLHSKLDVLTDQEAFYVNDQVKKDSYQAVFIDSADGQVYFGKLSDGEPGQVTLTDIYYLRTGEYGRGGIVSGGADVSLAKLGDELHGPEDVMHISRENVLFWENLKEDGQVVKAIREHKASL